MSSENSMGEPPPAMQDKSAIRYNDTGNGAIVAPAAVQPALWANIPAALRDRPHWCLAAPDKSPRNPTGSHASSTSPWTWCSFDTAAYAAYDRGWHIGYVLHESDPFTCIDFDVKDSTTQEEMDAFWAMAQFLDSYAELSRSGNGLHIWIKGKIGRGIKRGHVEFYSQERFIICTGNVRIDSPIRPHGDWLKGIAQQLMRGHWKHLELVEVPPTESDEAVLVKVRPKHAALFDALWRGEWHGRYPSQSEADMALLSYLVLHSVSNEQVRRLFRMSALGRTLGRKPKPDDYLNRTIKAMRSKVAEAQQMIARAQIGNFA